MQRKKVLRIVIFILIIMWMICVFCLSNQNGDESGGLSAKVASLFVSEDKIEIVEPYIRKIAHLSEYAVGGGLFLLLFLTYEISEIKQILFSLLIGIEYAAFDEIHQLFVGGRAGQLVDVYIDSVGVSIGICWVMLCYKIIIGIFYRKKAFDNK